MCGNIHMVAAVLSAIGALNWGLVGLFRFNLVEELGNLLGQRDLISRIVYVIVGIAGLYLLIDLFMPCVLFR